jgi:hypothetical protein
MLRGDRVVVLREDTRKKVDVRGRLLYYPEKYLI